jgi:hypothetical protein
MPLIKSSGQEETIAKKDDFVQRVEAGKVLPVIGGEVLADLVLGGQHDLVERYADLTGYPLPDRDDLPKMAKYHAIDQGKDDWGLKAHYCDVVKTHLYHLAKTQGIDDDLLAQAEDQVDNVTVSQFARLLDYPRFDGELDPLLILANLPLPIFVTTCYHTFLEAALDEAGKKGVRTDYLRWHMGLQDDSATVAAEHRATVQEPLVYHLFGVDTRPDSLVLTEDDYLRFLIAVSSEKSRTTELLPSQITTAFNTSAVVMLGFRLRSWAFRVLFWGLIKGSEKRNKGQINLQLRRLAEECKYLEAYLRAEAQFEVYWGDIRQYTQDLYRKWKG